MMDFYQGVVLEYLRADRSLFVNTQCLVQLNAAANPDKSGPHWYVDAVAVDFEAPMTAYLCEITYSKSASALLERLQAWNTHWTKLVEGLQRDSQVPQYPVRPWLFMPSDVGKGALGHIELLVAGSGGQLPIPRITPLECVAPWRYCSWDRKGEPHKPDWIPPAMRD